MLLEQLRKDAGKSPIEDSYKTGYLAACADILNISIEEISIND